MPMRRQEMEWSNDLDALVYCPEGEPPNWTICFLHGIGEAAMGEQDDRQDLRWTLAKNCSPALHCEVSSGLFDRFLVVCPQLGTRREWEPSDAAAVLQLINQACQRFELARRDNIVLTGFSIGGAGVFELANATPDKWVALWPIAPAITKTTPLPPSHLPVFLQYGRPDQRVEMQTVQDFIATWASLPNPELRVVRDPLLPNVLPSRFGHSQTCMAAYLDPDVHAWLNRMCPP
jgi:predicted esterase